MNNTTFKHFLTLISLIIYSQVFSQDNLNYQTPPKSIMDLLDAPSTPQVRINSRGTTMLLLKSPDFPSIEDVSQPVLRIGGLRINPATNSAFTSVAYTNIKIKTLYDKKEYQVSGLPEKARLGNITWSPDDKFIAFTNTTPAGVQLWIADLNTRSAKKISDLFLNDAYGNTLLWAPDSKSILAQFIPEGRGEAPKANTVPAGPVIQQNLGKAAPSRTYQDLLKNAYDESLFDYYLISQLKKAGLDGSLSNIGEPALYRRFSYSPNGEYVLTQVIKKPYSYLVPASMFPYQMQVLDQKGKLIKNLYSAPLADNRPSGFDAVDKGPRVINWRADKPAMLYWAEAQDEGNPNKAADIRDIIYCSEAPFNDKPEKIAECKFRFTAIDWSDDHTALVSERWWKTRTQRITLIDPAGKKVIKLISERSYEKTYTDPGSFVDTRNSQNRVVLLTDKQSKNPVVFTISDGASPQGDRPFLLRWDLISGKTDTLFRSSAPYYERPVFFNNNGMLIISRESTDRSPNYYILNLKNKKATALTSFPEPYPSLKGVQKQLLSYKRKDGLTMTGTLYLPKGYKKADGPLPMLMWAYPREFKDASAASQVKGSPFRYTRISWGSPIYWVTRGYAVLDNADMPIVGEGKNEPNDTFVQQVQDNAKAAIDYVSSLGVADPKRVAVGGHSYGAFMTANLLAHTNLFAAGIARSGAYNRTLTPFGFQQEERTYWQAPEVYYQMSPFSFADKIKTPLLMIHGEADDNSGTFPIQSERFYNALKGHGATARLVFLPNEAHAYRGKESVMHTLWEMDTWLEKYVKNKK